MSLNYETSAYLNGDIDLLTMSLYTKDQMKNTFMDYSEFVASALLGGALVSGLVGIALLRACAELIKTALERKRGQSRDNIDTIGNYTGTIPEFRHAITTLAPEAGIPPQAFIECVHPLPADPDYENFVYSDWLFPRTVSFHFLNYPRGFQGDTEDRRRDRRGRDGGDGGGDPPPVAPPVPPVPPVPIPPPPGGVPPSPFPPPPAPRRPPKNPFSPENSGKQADFYQKSNLYQRTVKYGDVKGRSYTSGQNNPLYIL